MTTIDINKIIESIERGVFNGIQEIGFKIHMDDDIEDVDNTLFEMANISKAKTGLCCIIWVQTNTPQSTGKHNAPRLKFSDDNKLIPVTISKNPQLLSGYKENELKIKPKELRKLFWQ